MHTSRRKQSGKDTIPPVPDSAPNCTTPVPVQQAGSRVVWVVALLMLALVAACGPRLQKASVRMMDEAEARWAANPVRSYHIVVDVERPDDTRRTEVTVEEGRITRGVVRYWDPRSRRWGEPYELNEEQAFPFTVPGLFDMVRGELRGSGRVDIRVAMGGEPAFPRRIVLGPVWQNGRPVPDTEARVTVRSFEPLVPNRD